jgi:hypothetical protein
MTLAEAEAFAAETCEFGDEGQVVRACACYR